MLHVLSPFGLTVHDPRLFRKVGNLGCKALNLLGLSNALLLQGVNFVGDELTCVPHILLWLSRYCTMPLN